jgi:hypothetical protein
MLLKVAFLEGFTCAKFGMEVSVKLASFAKCQDHAAAAISFAFKPWELL